MHSLGTDWNGFWHSLMHGLGTTQAQRRHDLGTVYRHTVGTVLACFRHRLCTFFSCEGTKVKAVKLSDRRTGKSVLVVRK